MNFVSDFIPLNLLEEKEKFFSNQSYNPQFRYVREFTADELTQWGKPNQNYFENVKKLLAEHGLSEAQHKNITTEAEIKTDINDLLLKIGVTTPLQVLFSDKVISRCSITKERIMFRLPIEFSRQELRNILNHEIQTHFLRRLNGTKQNWPHRSKRSVMLKTEEGLANLHTFVEGKDEYMRQSWVNYFAISLAQQHSFSKVFQILRELGVSEKKSWFITVRVKRGLQDTAQPGGNTRGLSYLEGSVQVWKWIRDMSHDPHDLYLGKLSIEEVVEKKQISTIEGLFYPTFFADMDAYRKRIEEIGLKNKFDVF